MQSYHGTSSQHAQSILAQGVNVALGGGELGKGFYSGEHLHEAKAWSFQTSGCKTANVVKLETPDELVLQLDLKLIEAGEAGLRRNYIRKSSQTRTFLFNCDMIWAPIVGSERVAGDQFKWESRIAESFLNNPSQTTKSVI